MAPQKVLKDCPFCGMSLDIDEPDVFHRSGFYWQESEILEGVKDYVPFRLRTESHFPCYEINCPTTLGGCDANIQGDTEEETINKWNNRV